jgi:hypothetical protein
MTFHRIAALALAALLVPLLAACGGAASPGEEKGGSFSTTSGELVPPGDSARQIAGTTAAAAPTAAPAATSAPPAEEPRAPDGDTAAAPLAPSGTPAPIIGAVPPAHQDQQQAPPLKAGEIDDNLELDTYRSYLANYLSGGVRKIDISERTILTVVNDQQQPVLDARVRLYDGEQLVFESRTYAGGRTPIFPRAIGLSDNAQLRLVVEKGQASAVGQLARGADEHQSIVLAGAAALPATPRLDVLFLLDATGSMGDEIGSIQQTIDDIARRIDQFDPHPELRLGLVSYRDHGDTYVTRLESNFTNDVAAFRTALMTVSADGGGDTPEDLNSGLEVAIQQMSWSEDAVRLVFLVADAPAHLDYGQEFEYSLATREAVRRGIKIYPIGASNTDNVAEYQFRQLAQQTLATFIFLTYQEGQSGGTPGDSTTMNVEPDQFTVDRLDDLVVLVVQRELRQALGMQ